jgi:Tfp pilus assembly protein PilX
VTTLANRPHPGATRRARTRPARQRGLSLIMVLIMMTALLVGSVMVLRSTEGSQLIVGNTAFKDSAVRAGELGINGGFTFIQALANEDANSLPRYYATTQPVDATTGMPTTVVWTGVPQVPLGNFQVQWVAERLCIAPLPVADVYAQCQLSQSDQMASNKAGSPLFQNPPIKYYRITARITGPRGTEQYVQSLVSR